MHAARNIAIQRLMPGEGIASVDDFVAIEEPLEIRVEGQSMAVVMRTPGDDRELAAGFLLTEGIIRSAKDLFDVTTCVAAPRGAERNAVDAALANPNGFDVTKLSRHVFTSSSCGVCGKVTIEAVMKRRKPLQDPTSFSTKVILSLTKRLAREQTTFKSTGGLHACALFDARGTLLALREDVGRHNALDKLAGWALFEKRTPLAGHLVLLSGRASFEMLQKAHAAGIPAVVAIGAPSSLAVDYARESGQILCGFVRGRSMNIYSGAERVTA